MTRRTLSLLLALASVDLAAGGANIGRFWDALVIAPLQWSGLATYIFLAFFVPGIATAVLATAVHVLRSPHTAGVRAVLSIVHVALGAVFLTFSPYWQGQCWDGPTGGGCATTGPFIDWFLFVPGLVLIVLGAVSLARLRLKP